MIINIHGKEIEYDSKQEYGLYFPTEMNFQQYSIMYIPETIKMLNELNFDKVIEQAKILQKIAEEQIQWKSVPGIIGAPLLKFNKKSVPIDEVRKNIENTKLFAKDLIKVLGGK